MGRLTTHVLDVASGKPASGMTITLQEIDGDSRREVCEITTNADGRADEPLLNGDAFRVGVWELAFNVADYFVAAVSRRRPDSFWHFGKRRKLSRAPARNALELFHLPR